MRKIGRHFQIINPSFATGNINWTLLAHRNFFRATQYDSKFTPAFQISKFKAGNLDIASPTDNKRN